MPSDLSVWSVCLFGTYNLACPTKSKNTQNTLVHSGTLSISKPFCTSISLTTTQASIHYIKKIICNRNYLKQFESYYGLHWDFSLKICRIKQSKNTYKSSGDYKIEHWEEATDASIPPFHKIAFQMRYWKALQMLLGKKKKKKNETHKFLFNTLWVHSLWNTL